MKSVGEVMAIGRTFQESLQKALRSLETGLTGLDEIEIPGLGQSDDKNAMRAALGTPTPDRLLQVAQAMRLGWSVEEIYDVLQDRPVVPRADPRHRRHRSEGRAHGLPPHAHGMRALKAHGLFRRAPRRCWRSKTEAEVRRSARALGVRPVFKRIDTCAAEFASPTAYMYSTYETPFAGARRRRERAVATARRSSSSAAARTASARASSSTIAAATPASRCATPATKPS